MKPTSKNFTKQINGVLSSLASDSSKEINITALDGGEIAPTSIVKIVLNHRSTSVKEEVRSNIALMEGVELFRDDAARRAEIIRPLINLKMLPTDAEKLLDAGGSHLSMLKKISDNAHLLLDSKILQFLQGGYSVLYQAALLAEDLEGDIDRLSDALKSIDGLLTRENILGVRRAVKAVDLSRAELANKAETFFGGNEVGRKRKDSQDVGNASAILLTPSGKDVAKLGKDYTADGEPACLRAKAANALIIAARAKDLPVITGKLPCWGFSSLSHLYLLKPPTRPDLTQADIIAVCERGKPKLKRLEKWPSEENAKAIAEELLDQADGKRIHLFAKESADGWETVVGDANWTYDVENET